MAWRLSAGIVDGAWWRRNMAASCPASPAPPAGPARPRAWARTACRTPGRRPPASLWAYGRRPARPARIQGTAGRGWWPRPGALAPFCSLAPVLAYSLAMLWVEIPTPWLRAKRDQLGNNLDPLP